MHFADFPRHLGRQITRCLIAHLISVDQRALIFTLGDDGALPR
jgi:hypothetical protein